MSMKTTSTITRTVLASPSITGAATDCKNGRKEKATLGGAAPGCEDDGVSSLGGAGFGFGAGMGAPGCEDDGVSSLGGVRFGFGAGMGPLIDFTMPSVVS